MVPGVAGVAGVAVAGRPASAPATVAVTPDTDPDDPDRDGTVRRRSDPDDDDPDPAERPGAAALLREDDGTWAGPGDDRVPRVRPDDDPDDMSGWDDVSDSAWLTGTPPADDATEG